VLGVQWHPELGWERDQFARALFDRFVSEATQFATHRAEDVSDRVVQYSA